MRFPPVFDNKEAAILIAMYQAQNGTYDSYTLAWKLNPKVEVGTPSADVAFTETRDATERLIERSLIRGERFSGVNGVYFKKLKLTPKGERMAIQQRKTAEETAQAIAEAIEQTKDLLPKIVKRTDNK